jgi:hypothetical protein
VLAALERGVEKTAALQSSIESVRVIFR